MRVAFQGETGAFSEQAVRAYYESERVRTLPMPSFEEVFSAVAGGRADAAAVPIENSLFGSVHANYDLLQEHELHIVGELKLRVVHHLMAFPGVELRDVRRVYSHPQAIGQCRAFLRSELPSAEIIAAYDTAGAAKMVASAEDRSCAAIASEAAAGEYGLEILARGIESDHRNFTRFLMLQREGRTDEPGDDAYKTSIVYAMKQNVPGALFKSLAVFALRELDLLKIESRPLVGQPWAYLFYLDFKGWAGDASVKRALDHLSELAAYLKVLGSYPAGRVVG